uniref:Leucine-rich repeat protein n=1 Tax=Archangium gephyra TaxID=48 RepID=A0A7D5SCS3_9BACT|nr:leucine-rich repeat protein [Archangium gephyra]
MGVVSVLVQGLALAAPPETGRTPAPVPAGNAPLPPEQLAKQRVYTSLEDALREPHKVYRLELRRPESSWGNTLTKLPAEVVRLVRLQELTVSGHPLEFVPEELGQLQNLEHLELSNCRLREFPTPVLELKRLRTLVLDDNGDIDELPQDIDRLSELTRLSLKTVVSIEKLPASIARLSRLKSLSLEYTHLTQLPSSVLALTELEELNLRGLCLTKLPSGIGGLKRLQRLVVGNIEEDPDPYEPCALRTVPRELGQLSALVELDLTDRWIQSLPEELKNLRKLEVLSLGHNQLRRFPGFILKLPALRRLSVTGNAFKVPNALGSLKTLQYVELDSTQNDIETGLRSALPGVEWAYNEVEEEPAGEEDEEEDAGPSASVSSSSRPETSKVSEPANPAVLKWLGMPVHDFGCLLQKSFGHRDSRFNCSTTASWLKSRSCADPSFFNGPTFPTGKSSRIHRRVKGVEVNYEGGRVSALTIKLDKRLSDNDVRHIFGLSRSLPSNIARYRISSCGWLGQCLTLEASSSTRVKCRK